MEIAPNQGFMSIQGGAQGALASAITKIQHLEVARIQQKRKLLEAVSCLEQQNMYTLYAGEGTETPLFWVQENSSCIQRNCLPNDCAPWNLSYHDIGPEGLPEGNSGKHFPEFLRIERPCSLTCCCFNRPEATIMEMPSGRVLGKLRDPFDICSWKFQIQDAAGVERLKTQQCCCQLGTFCPCPGNTINLPVLDSGDQHEVAKITKTWMCGDCFPCFFKDWSNVSVRFGDATDPDYKLLLLSLGNFVQLRLFDSRNQN